MLHVGAPNVGDRRYFDELVDGIFERRWFTNDGVLVKQLEQKLCDYLGVKHCLLVSSATVGLQLACHALELAGEVIVPSFTFVATPHSVRWEGLTPVFADIDPSTHTICPESVRSKITERTSAILGVHLWGTPCETECLNEIAERHGLEVYYDAAHAFGTKHRGQMIGNFGRCEVFSFHATKFFNTFEGGAIVTNCDVLAKRLSLMRNFGFAGMDEVVYLGTNAKMPEICAAMGLSLFSCLDSLMQQNELNHRLYRAHLEDVPGVRLLTYESVEQTNHQYVVLEIDESAFGQSRDELMFQLHEEGVRVRRYFYPGCHRMEPYRSEGIDWSPHLRNTESVSDRVLCLPTGNAMDETAIDRVCAAIRRIGASARENRPRNAS
ncbi:MAG: DegT/DnrJ/EryC1/StrS family aminotransferase [Planctomycetota bacterium]